MSLYSETFHSKQLKELLSDECMIKRMLQVENALLAAQVKEGLITLETASNFDFVEFIHQVDIKALKADIRLSGNAAIPLIRQLTQIANKTAPQVARFIHLGATSQDIVDSANALTIKAFTHWLRKHLAVLTRHLVELTKSHYKTIMKGRTILQPASPIPFGLKTAGWLDSIGRSATRIDRTGEELMLVSLTGSVGGGNPYISGNVSQSMAQELGLQSGHSWHTHRDRLADWASALAILNGSLGKISKDISLMMQSEIGELHEGKSPGKGKSSTMPHKRNPVLCSLIMANATKTPGLASSLLQAMLQEHERSAGLWQAEWETQQDLISLTGGSVEMAIDLISNLEVDTGRMASNMESTNGLIYSERLTLILSKELGKKAAFDLVQQACELSQNEKIPLREVVKRLIPGIPNLETIFDPLKSCTSAFQIIDAVIDRYEDAI